MEEKSQQQEVELNISGLFTGKQFTLQKVQTVNELELPQQSIGFEELRPYLNGLPIESYRDTLLGILFGLDNTRLKTTLRLRKGREYQPVSAKTRLGWLLYDHSGHKPGSSSQHILHIGTRTIDNELHELVKSFFLH